MLSLVAAIKQLHQEYFYTSIELDVCSPGGQVHALDYCVETMDHLRARGVRFTTRALMSVSSAAANLVSLGDHRIASRGATFLYHQARAGGMDAVTVQSARQILNAVDKIDERYLNRLVGQARRGECPRTTLHPRDFADNDWPVIEHLLTGASVVPAQVGRAQLSRRTLLQRLRKHVAACLLDDDDSTLRRLYRGLFELDRHISAGLALALGLIDAISDESTLESGEVMADQACIPEWAPLFSPEGRVSRPHPVPAHAGAGRDRLGQDRLRDPADHRQHHGPGEPHGRLHAGHRSETRNQGRHRGAAASRHRGP